MLYSMPDSRFGCEQYSGYTAVRKVENIPLFTTHHKDELWCTKKGVVTKDSKHSHNGVVRFLHRTSEVSHATFVDHGDSFGLFRPSLFR